MTSRMTAVLALPLVLAVVGGVQPRAGIALSGMIKFPREQRMSIETGASDGSKLTVRMGFDGRCRGGALGEAWASEIQTRPAVRVRDGSFAADLHGSVRDLGGVKGRTGEFTWRLTGRFTARDAATATVSGSAVIRAGGRVVARCRIASPASVRLTTRGA